MKILVVSFYYEPEIGAAPNRITNLVHGLQKQGNTVDVLTCLPNYPKGKIFEGYRHRFSMKEQSGDGSIYRYWTYATVSSNVFKRALAMSSFSIVFWLFGFHFKRIRQYDSVIVQTPPIFVAYSAVTLFGKLFRKKVFLNVSDLWPGSAIELGYLDSSSRTCRMLYSMERFIYRNSVAVIGQSDEILAKVRELYPEKTTFLYRNLSPYTPDSTPRQAASAQANLKIVYAGLLGVPQDILSLIRNVDFSKYGAELHLYGGGNQADEIKEEIESGKAVNVFYHGILSKSEMNRALAEYDISLIALSKSIRGAVPSKIFDILPLGLPILFAGDGEGARLVEENGFGLVSKPSDFQSLADNVSRFSTMSREEMDTFSCNCRKASEDKFNFSRQMALFDSFLKEHS